jgi:hypothetical protein
MIIKIFKIDTLEMCTIYHKKALIKFIKDELGFCLSGSMTVKQLIEYLPVEQYYRVK